MWLSLPIFFLDLFVKGELSKNENCSGLHGPGAEICRMSWMQGAAWEVWRNSGKGLEAVGFQAFLTLVQNLHRVSGSLWCLMNCA